MLAERHFPLNLSPIRRFELNDVVACRGAIDVFACQETNERRAPIDLRTGGHLHVRGWSLALSPPAVFERYFFVVGNIVFPVKYGLARDDVAKAFGGPKFGACGFDVSLPVNMLSPGEYELTLVGVLGNRLERLAETAKFRVLAVPELVSAIAAPTTLPGRLRRVSETHVEVRRDGRPQRAIRNQSSFEISGWLAASPAGAVADKIAVVLSGYGRHYRIPAQRRWEPEAGLVLGAAGAACGYQTYVAADDLQPGIYDVDIEILTGGTYQIVATGDRVEIMSRPTTWLPLALPTYHTALSGGLDIALPKDVKRNDTLRVAGWFEQPAAVSGIYARIDGEYAYELTSGITTSANSGFGDSEIGIFGALVAMELSEGAHEIEILALDTTHSGVWSIERHAFNILPKTFRQVKD